MSGAELFLVTAYCLGRVCLANDHGVTKSGAVAVVGYTAACDRAVLPFSTRFKVDGLPNVWVCEDIGPMINGRHVDLFFNSKQEADAWGSRTRRLRVLWRPDRPTKLPPWDSRGPRCPRPNDAL